MYILGISCYYHDSSACLIKDGEIIAVAEEEKFTRKKHDNSYPINAIKFCLEYGKIESKNLDCVCFYEKPLLKFQRIINQHLQMAPFSFKTFCGFFPSWVTGKLLIESKIKNSLNYNGAIYFIEHHQSHIASSFFPSPFQEAAFLSVDGVGEWDTTTYGIGKGNKIKILKKIEFPHSLGLFYSTITAYLGFSVNNSEYKVMGLSSYGDMNQLTNKYYKKLKKVIDIKDNGSYQLDMTYFDFHYKERMPSKKLCYLLDGPISAQNSEMTQRHKDIAAAVQMITEEAIIKMLNHVYKETKCNNLVFAGGCALNSVINGKILKNTPFENIYIQPAAGDGGTSVGAALFCYHQILDHKKRNIQDTAYLGPEFSDEFIRGYLDTHFINYQEFNNKEELIKKTAELIYADNVIGWFQGRMEFGPRALGSRSILSNATNPKMQEILNLKVKHREKFRPFAPVVCEDDALKYFDCDDPISLPTSFMLMVYPIKKEYREKIPAVTHIDGSGRLQTIRKEKNPDYYNLVKEFGKLSGIPILINTSFNIRGEPIVCKPKDAYNCMMGTGINYLIMGNFLIKREDNLEDAWDSETLAKD